MFFVMRDFYEYGITHSRRVGRPMKKLESAKKLAWIKRGYVLNDLRQCVAQATHSHLPQYIGNNQNV